MPRPMRGQIPEKSKDFKGSMKRLFNSLNNWRYLLVFALALGLVSAILALITPNKLSELTDYLVDEYSSKNIGISLPYLRLDNFSMEIAEKIQQVRKSGLTFAPEAGTQRLRDVINKGVSEEDLYRDLSDDNARNVIINNFSIHFLL